MSRPKNPIPKHDEIQPVALDELACGKILKKAELEAPLALRLELNKEELQQE